MSSQNYFLGDEFGSIAQAAYFFIFFLDYVLQAIPFSSICKGVSLPFLLSFGNFLS